MTKQLYTKQEETATRFAAYLGLDWWYIPSGDSVNYRAAIGNEKVGIPALLIDVAEDGRMAQIHVSASAFSLKGIMWV